MNSYTKLRIDTARQPTRKINQVAWLFLHQLRFLDRAEH